MLFCGILPVSRVASDSVKVIHQERLKNTTPQLFFAYGCGMTLGTGDWDSNASPAIELRWKNVRVITNVRA